MPGLDGLRAVAVLSVVVYHLGAGWLPGGLLGVGIFFTLSGYLITDLLLQQWRRNGRVQLRDFWVRRARRLLPALFLMLAVVVIWVAVGDHAQLGAVRGDALSAAVYVNNWWLIAHHMSYFARFAPPSPLGNLWSLAVEEQFYLVWPWLLVAGLVWAGHRRASRRAAEPNRAFAALSRIIDGEGSEPPTAGRQVPRPGLLVAAILVLAAGSALEMALLYHPTFDPTRIYDGTDTRAFGLLIGAALAVVWPSTSLPTDVAPQVRRLVEGAGVVGLGGAIALMVTTGQYSPFLYRGGMVLLSLSTVLVLVSVTHPASRFGRVLGWEPLRRIGVISYGIYLWHFPIIILTTPSSARGGDDPLRATVQVVVVVLIAAASWRFVESPIRGGAIGRWWHALRQNHGSGEVPARRWATFTGIACTVVVLVAALAGTLPSAPAGTLAVAISGSATGKGTIGTRGIKLKVTAPHPAPTRPTTSSSADPGPRGGSVAPTTTTTVPAQPRTSCTAVATLGDSTSESLVSNNYLPNPQQQLPAQYERVGVTNVQLDIVGGDSIVEHLPGQQNMFQLAQQLLQQGFRGCWVLALGTNDSADIAVGSNVSAAQRIQKMMTLLAGQPVMWVNVVTLLSSGPYSESNMQAWNQTLLAACPAYPNMKVFDWAAMAQPSYFISDGIHYTSAGSAVRAAAYANALAAAFPADAPAPHGRGHASSSCVVKLS